MSDVQTLGAPGANSALTFDSTVYPVRTSGGDILSQAADAQMRRLAVSKDLKALTTTVTVSRAGDPDPETPDVTVDGLLTYVRTDPATEIILSLTAASLPEGSVAAVTSPDNPDIGLPPTKIRSGRFISQNFEPSLFDKPVRLQLKYWSKGQVMMSSGSLAFDVSRLTTMDAPGSHGVLRDPDSNRPIALVPDAAAAAVRIGQLTCVLQRD